MLKLRDTDVHVTKVNTNYTLLGGPVIIFGKAGKVMAAIADVDLL